VEGLRVEDYDLASALDAAIVRLQATAQAKSYVCGGEREGEGEGNRERNGGRGREGEGYGK
jgi:hypothetical protein